MTSQTFGASDLNSQIPLASRLTKPADSSDNGVGADDLADDLDDDWVCCGSNLVFAFPMLPYVTLYKPFLLRARSSSSMKLTAACSNATTSVFSLLLKMEKKRDKKD